MATVPLSKKLKLSNPDEPLTQNDVISFQKEALYRCMNEKRVSLNAVNEQFEVSKKNYIDVSTKLSNLMALIITLANFLQVISKEKNNTEEENICSKMATSDENEVIQLSDSFMKILTKYLTESGNATIDDNERLSRLALELKELQKVKKELYYKNKELADEISSLKIYYEKLIKKFDREDSQTLKRVFKKELEGEDETVKENKDTANSRDMENVKIETKTSTTESPGIDEKDEDKITSGNSDIKEEKLMAEYDIKVSDLQNEIKELKVIIEEVEKFKNSNTERIVSLEKQLSAANSASAGLERNDNIDVDVMKSKIDILIRENNQLKQINDSFLGKFQKLSSEKEIFNNKITNEFSSNLEGLKTQNLALEKDLVRIRTARDDLLSKLSIVEAETKTPIILDDLKKSLDLSNEQWKKYENRLDTTSENLLLKELQDMEIAFKELTQINNKKYSDLINQESMIAKLKVEKTKADQKYFAAMRSKDPILIENKNMGKAITKTNELILQMKDAEKLLQQKIENLYKQLQLSQNNEKRLIESTKQESLKIIDLNSQINKSEKKISVLKNESLDLITGINKLKTQNNELETENKVLKQKNINIDEKCKKLHQKLVSFTGEVNDKKRHYEDEDEDTLTQELENFRTLVYCSLCSKNWKNMAIKTCGHVFCEDCCNERLAARMRKCPTCNYPFSSNDLLPIHL
ncbi:similar to Saccharomyces cerevisiae YDL074C BRE1 E3 ubiquitin ligase [Maudiozyma saulgeensis]|uniref:E3 ubiquitin protein ligase n=1 Tax=Maudiozyma saulgeensis TaxID=1789683 RepID=A0A1X7QZN1_9SACH|nr:similar to Saccharomyces cerevisiae YDL074C BRE1 E3 ubiquitin ligase [Kazachstania saulgeensis]